MAVETTHALAGVPQAPSDVMFGLSAAYRADENPKKVDLGVGAYRGGDGKPFVLPAVRKACSQIRSQITDKTH
jgi:aspartate/tyrosine/aromatic aminotransferase